MQPFRLYVKQGCPFCEKALEWFRNTNITTSIVEIGNDPILNAGVNTFGGNVPLVVSFVTNEVIKGFKAEEYERLVQVFLERNNPSSFAVVDTAVVHSEPPTEPAKEMEMASAAS